MPDVIDDQDGPQKGPSPDELAERWIADLLERGERADSRDHERAATEQVVVVK